MSDVLSLNTGELADVPPSTLHGLLAIVAGEPADQPLTRLRPQSRGGSAASRPATRARLCRDAPRGQHQPPGSRQHSGLVDLAFYPGVQTVGGHDAAQVPSAAPRAAGAGSSGGNHVGAVANRHGFRLRRSKPFLPAVQKARWRDAETLPLVVALGSVLNW
jgi:hypothetical protein